MVRVKQPRRSTPPSTARSLSPPSYLYSDATVGNSSLESGASPDARPRRVARPLVQSPPVAVTVLGPPLLPGGRPVRVVRRAVAQQAALPVPAPVAARLRRGPTNHSTVDAYIRSKFKPYITRVQGAVDVIDDFIVCAIDTLLEIVNVRLDEQSKKRPTMELIKGYWNTIVLTIPRDPNGLRGIEMPDVLVVTDGIARGYLLTRALAFNADWVIMGPPALQSLNYFLAIFADKLISEINVRSGGGQVTLDNVESSVQRTRYYCGLGHRFMP